MKTLLTKTLFISLLFSAVAPSVMQAEESKDIFAKLAAKAIEMKDYAGEKVGEARSYASGKIDVAKNYLGEFATKNPNTMTNLRYSAYAVGIASVTYGVCKFFKSKRFKDAWSNKWKRFGIVSASLLAGAALYAGAVKGGYAPNPSDIRNSLSLAWKSRNWQVKVPVWEVKKT